MRSRVAFADRGRLPEEPGVYLLYHRRRLLYVGQTVNLRARWRAHHTSLAAMQLLDRLRIEYELHPLEELLNRERALILDLRPPWNKNGKQVDGQHVHMIFEADLLKKVEDWAWKNRVNRSEAIHKLLRLALERKPKAKD